jgi:tRNA pseudouridine(38-40) synthase
VHDFRFSARYREYKYFIVDRDNSLDLSAMRAAMADFVGPHDFRWGEAHLSY